MLARHDGQYEMEIYLYDTNEDWEYKCNVLYDAYDDRGDRWTPPSSELVVNDLIIDAKRYIGDMPQVVEVSKDMVQWLMAEKRDYIYDQAWDDYYYKQSREKEERYYEE